MQVTLNIFSGRPNPQWVLTRQEPKEFYRAFHELPENPVGIPSEQGLGYRGFMVTEVEDSIEGCNDIVVFKEDVIARCNGKTHQFIDKERKLERWLLHTGKGRIDDGLYQLVLAEIKED